ncbi:MAG TPA: DUF3987 domain-containing protein [Candidatus Saccharimonadales bacterium]|nr:DUF3987 domain-containing protein [Candidatus Saccharimonadales bacterium]
MARINYKKLVPPDSFIGRYLEYCSNSETPYAYDFWSAAWLLACAAGRGVVVSRGSASVHLNLFVIFVADSGTTRKSTAVRSASKFARSISGEDVAFIESRITPEKLEFDLAMQSAEYGYAYATVAIDELVKFLGQEKYVKGMPTLLTDLYDSPEIRTGGGTLLRGSVTLRKVFINFLSASTPSWLLRAVNPDVIEGGFTSRVIFVVAEQAKQQLAFPGEVNETLRQEIQSSLRDVRDQAARTDSIPISEGARKRFISWYKSRDKKRDTFRASFQSREDAHILRLAALLSISDGLWEIQANHISLAIRIITETREDGATIFEGTGTNSRLVIAADAIRDKVLAGGLGGVKQGDITKSLQGRATAEDIKTILNIMHDLGMVQRFENIQVGRGRPVTIWRGQQALLNSKAIDEVIESL